jgi:hypothetical protein
LTTLSISAWAATARSIASLARFHHGGAGQPSKFSSSTTNSGSSLAGLLLPLRKGFERAFSHLPSAPARSGGPSTISRVIRSVAGRRCSRRVPRALQGKLRQGPVRQTGGLADQAITSSGGTSAVPRCPPKL